MQRQLPLMGREKRHFLRDVGNGRGRARDQKAYLRAGHAFAAYF